MPTYEYECLSCKYEFEAFQKITDDSLKECPRCNGMVKRKISAGSGVLFKGSGFYTTDYRSENYKKKASEEKPKTEAPKEKSEPPKPSKPPEEKP